MLTSTSAFIGHGLERSAEFAPKVSIVIPVYNGSDYLRAAIESALAQSYENLEVIVVNDGSSDGGKTEAVAQSFGDKIRYFRKANGGCGSALNSGIKLMTGEYFSWLSHDDLYLPNKISHQISLLRSLHNKRTIVYGGYELIDADSKSIGFVRPQTVGSAEKLNYPLFPLLKGLIHGCSLLIHKQHFMDYGIFDESLKTTQDYDLWYRFFQRVPVLFDDKVLIKSRVHPRQGTHSISTHRDELDALWTRFVTGITREQAIAIDGSRYRFYKNIKPLLHSINCTDARDVASKLADETLREVTVSIVIPFFNRIEWTIEALQSALSQTHKNLDIILIDDGSTDDTSALENVIRDNPNVRLFKQPNAGAASARNRGIELAEGEYVALLDADDKFSPDKVESQLIFMEEQNLDFSHTSYTRIDASGQAIETIDTSYFHGRLYPRIIASCPIATPTVMARTSLLRQHPFPQGIGIGEDVLTWISVANSCQIGALNKPLSQVRISAGTTINDSRKMQRGILNIVDGILEHPQHGDNHREILQLIYFLNRLRTQEYRLHRKFDPPYRRNLQDLKSDLSRMSVSAAELAKRGVWSIRNEGPIVAFRKFQRWRRRSES